MSSAAPLSLSLIMMLISWSRLVPGSWFRSAARRRKSAASHALIIEAVSLTAFRFDEPLIWPVRASITAQDQKPGEEIVTGPAWISGRATGVETATVGVGLVGAGAPRHWRLPVSRQPVSGTSANGADSSPRT